MRLYRPCQHPAFAILPLGNQIILRIGMIDDGHILRDDRVFIEIGGHIMGRRADLTPRS